MALLFLQKKGKKHDLKQIFTFFSILLHFCTCKIFPAVEGREFFTLCLSTLEARVLDAERASQTDSGGGNFIILHAPSWWDLRRSLFSFSHIYIYVCSAQERVISDSLTLGLAGAAGQATPLILPVKCARRPNVCTCSRVARLVDLKCESNFPLSLSTTFVPPPKILNV